VSDDPEDAFDAFADSIRRTEDELEAADALRSEKAAAKRKEGEQDALPSADAEPPEAK
jgi:hypothetical protein